MRTQGLVKDGRVGKLEQVGGDEVGVKQVECMTSLIPPQALHSSEIPSLST